MSDTEDTNNEIDLPPEQFDLTSEVIDQPTDESLQAIDDMAVEDEPPIEEDPRYLEPIGPEDREAQRWNTELQAIRDTPQGASNEVAREMGWDRDPEASASESTAIDDSTGDDLQSADVASDGTVHIADDDELHYTDMSPNTRYEKNGYTFITDDHGRPSMMQGVLQDVTGDRSRQQTEVGHLGNEGDEGGHMIATRFDGPPDGFNLVPQDMHLNRGEWKAMESEWGDALKRGDQVEVGVQPIYLDDTPRPAGFDVIYRTFGESGEQYQTKTFYNESSKGHADG